MKRTPLQRKTPLRSGTSLGRGQGSATAPQGRSAGLRRATPLGRGSGTAARLTARRAQEPGEAQWKRRRHGRCQGCGHWGRIVLHHVLPEQVVRRHATPEQVAAGIVWDQRNAMRLGAPRPWGGRCTCHDDHHHPGVRDTRLHLSRLPGPAFAFARELLGATRAELELARRYQGGERLARQLLKAAQP